MGTAFDWYVEAQRIQSSKTIRDASYSIWTGTALVLMRNAIWAGPILAFFVLYPNLTDQGQYELAWFRIAFEVLPAGMLGFFFASILASWLKSISNDKVLSSEQSSTKINSV